ncbi:uncharacterized protein A4U43_UnF5570 [Asparagus officinalis]|uniref:Uncharacterized protein n=1 Tax=Asparagus officinalis TaxID=4686 RepID=A0A1R3L6N4_ASPOF|nr:uncharacterized protein LOC109827573 [Asparagus officinalis]XP_020250167.1 uncharacterized protein LOC109827573 [Asparagus officinalis]ONK55281.1 uncharacterized protein A4U43_UnF5570 [Asparagus officinalis]
MGSAEPALVPEWYRAGKGGKASNNVSDGNGVGLSGRKRLPLIPCEQESKQSSIRSSSGAQAYSNFGRRDRKKNPDTCDRDRDRESSRDYRGSRDSIIGSRTDTDRRWRSNSAGEIWPKKLESESKSGAFARGNVNNGGIKRGSAFKREFPTLASIEKKSVLESGRVSTAVQSVPIPNLVTVGGDRWTSPLAEVPSEVGDSTLASPVSPLSLSRSNSAGLNMAEALINASFRAQISPQSSSGTSRAEELAIRQSKQLIPVTSSMLKTSGLNSSEKSKFRGPVSPGANNAPRAPAYTKSDIPKSSQIGNLQVLSREKTGVISPSAAKDSSSQDISPKSPINSNPKTKNRDMGMSLLPFGEKRPLSLAKAKNRNDFFNSLRTKSSVINNSSADSNPEPSDSIENSLSLEENAMTCGDVSIIGQDSENESATDISVINLEETIVSESPKDIEGNQQSPPVDIDEKDKAFMKSLGWKEDAKEEALTNEEISAFIKKYKKLKPRSCRFQAFSLSPKQTKF